MTNRHFHIIPYSETLREQVTELEQGITQGKSIQLEIIKKHFLDRAFVFKNYYPNLAVTTGNKIIGSAIGSATTMIVNGIQFEAGFGFDAKVLPGWRKMGIGKVLAKDLYRSFFQHNGLTKCFMTAKLSNAQILKVVNRVLGKVWLYEFVYLTLPTSARIKQPGSLKKEPQQFTVQLFDSGELNPDYYTKEENGLGVFSTWKMYTLRIKKINWLYKQGIALLKKIQPLKYKYLPAENEVLSFVTLYNHTDDNINGINEILKRLETTNIKYLLVCCRKNDCIYNYLKSYSINTYKYYLVSDFKIKKNDNITIDVRCL